MKKIEKLCVIGDEKRQIYIAELLCEKGGEAIFYNGNIAQKKLSDFNCFLLPVPVSRDGYRLNCSNEILLMELSEALPNGCSVIGGKIPSFFVDHLLNKNINICDFYDDKEYLWKNARITAEGAVHLLMGEGEFALSRMRILICGYGRIGKCLAQMLSSLGADVTVAVRRREVVFEASVCNGLKSILIEDVGINGNFDAVFNTVPSIIFEGRLLKMLENAIYIELASAPYGGDWEILERYCRKYILASGIPGKYAPRSDSVEAYKVISKHIFGEEII